MTEAVKKPGIVIFTAVLNYVAVVVYALVAVFSLLVLVMGTGFQLYQKLSQQIHQYYPEVDLTGVVGVVFGVVLFLSLFSIAFHVWLALGLLSGKKSCWYTQVVMSVIGLISFPIGTVLNIVILIFFFQPLIREYFKV